MARKRTALSAKAESALALLMKQGKTAEEIAKALRAKGVKGVSARTVSRRLQELRGKRRAGRVAKSKKGRARASEGPPSEIALPESPDKIPADLSVDALHRMRTKAELAANEALANEDLATFAAMGRLMTSLTDAIRKATPPKEDDPNDNPDMRALGERVAERLHKLIDQIAATS